MYNLRLFENKLHEVESWLGRELSNIRTGRATPALLDTVTIEQYDTRSKISHVAAISVEDPKTLRISPWDKTTIKLIESALQAANLGVSVVVDGAGLWVIFPELTNERRKLLQKLANEKLEGARISVKKEREEVWNQIIREERDAVISEDEKFSLKDEIQKFVDDVNKRLREAVDRKEQEISQ